MKNFKIKLKLYLFNLIVKESFIFNKKLSKRGLSVLYLNHIFAVNLLGKFTLSIVRNESFIKIRLFSSNYYKIISKNKLKLK